VIDPSPTSPPQPLMRVASQANHALRRFDADLRAGGFGHNSRGLARDLYASFAATTVATRGTEDETIAWAIGRALAIDLDGAGAPRGALALLDGLIAFGGARADPKVLDRLRETRDAIRQKLGQRGEESAKASTTTESPRADSAPPVEREPPAQPAFSPPPPERPTVAPNAGEEIDEQAQTEPSGPRKDSLPPTAPVAVADASHERWNDPAKPELPSPEIEPEFEWPATESESPTALVPELRTQNLSAPETSSRTQSPAPDPGSPVATLTTLQAGVQSVSETDEESEAPTPEFESLAPDPESRVADLSTPQIGIQSGSEMEPESEIPTPEFESPAPDPELPVADPSTPQTGDQSGSETDEESEPPISRAELPTLVAKAARFEVRPDAGIAPQSRTRVSHVDLPAAFPTPMADGESTPERESEYPTYEVKSPAPFTKHPRIEIQPDAEAEPRSQSLTPETEPSAPIHVTPRTEIHPGPQVRLGELHEGQPGNGETNSGSLKGRQEPWLLLAVPESSGKTDLRADLDERPVEVLPDPLSARLRSRRRAQPVVRAATILAFFILYLLVSRDTGPLRHSLSMLGDTATSLTGALRTAVVSANTPPGKMSGSAPVGSNLTAPVEDTSEKLPSPGVGQLLTSEEVRYCVFQGRRLDFIRDQVSGDIRIQRFNALVRDFNSRCGLFRFQNNALRVAKGLADARQEQLKADAGGILAAWESTGNEPLIDVQTHQGAAAVQARLKALGYYHHNVDGVWGLRSEVALSRFRRTMGLGSDGTWDLATQSALLAR
jgi:hypothetical protein